MSRRRNADKRRDKVGGLAYRILTIVGGSKTTRDAWLSWPADEIWTLAYLADEVPATRLFEMHLKDDLPHDRWENAKQQPVTVYMPKDYEEIPNAEQYPIAEIARSIFGRLYLGDAIQARPFGSTFDYMLALAIHENWKRVNICGFDMDETAEYFYQRPGAHLLIGQALGHGIEVHIAPGSTLIDNRMYGYQGYPKLTGEARERVEWVLDRMAW